MTSKLKLEAIDRLVYNAVFGSDEVGCISMADLGGRTTAGSVPIFYQGLYEAREGEM